MSPRRRGRGGARRSGRPGPGGDAPRRPAAEAGALRGLPPEQPHIESEIEPADAAIEPDDDRVAAAAAGPAGSAAAGLASFLRSLGIDSRRDPEFTVTAELTAAFLAERTAGLREEPRPIRPSRYRGRAGETVRLERIPVYGMCPHHLVPYFGHVQVRYTPSDRVCGIGSIVRLVRELSCVPRLQESLTQAIADTMERDLEPSSLEVVVRARHLCLEMRGVEQRALFVTEARRGGEPGPQQPRAPEERPQQPRAPEERPQAPEHGPRGREPGGHRRR